MPLDLEMTTKHSTFPFATDQPTHTNPLHVLGDFPLVMETLVQVFKPSFYAKTIPKMCFKKTLRPVTYVVCFNLGNVYPSGIYLNLKSSFFCIKRGGTIDP